MPAWVSATGTPECRAKLRPFLWRRAKNHARLPQPQGTVSFASRRVSGRAGGQATDNTPWQAAGPPFHSVSQATPHRFFTRARAKNRRIQPPGDPPQPLQPRWREKFPLTPPPASSTLARSRGKSAAPFTMQTTTAPAASSSAATPAATAATATAPPLRLADPALLKSGALLGDHWCAADSGETFPVKNPATGATLGTVPKMGAAETQRAIEAAQIALPAWKALPGKTRANILRKWNDLILANAEDLAAAHDRRAGQAAGRVARARSPTRRRFIEWFAEEAKRVYGDDIPAIRAPTSASSCSSSRSGSARRSRRGISRPP